MEAENSRVGADTWYAPSETRPRFVMERSTAGEAGPFHDQITKFPNISIFLELHFLKSQPLQQACQCRPRIHLRGFQNSIQQCRLL
jgi:hypothetical protein